MIFILLPRRANLMLFGRTENVCVGRVLGWPKPGQGRARRKETRVCVVAVAAGGTERCKA